MLLLVLSWNKHANIVIMGGGLGLKGLSHVHAVKDDLITLYFVSFVLQKGVKNEMGEMKNG